MIKCSPFHFLSLTGLIFTSLLLFSPLMSFSTQTPQKLSVWWIIVSEHQISHKVSLIHIQHTVKRGICGYSRTAAIQWRRGVGVWVESATEYTVQLNWSCSFWDFMTALSPVLRMIDVNFEIPWNETLTITSISPSRHDCSMLLDMTQPCHPFFFLWKQTQNSTKPQQENMSVNISYIQGCLSRPKLCTYFSFLWGT